MRFVLRIILVVVHCIIIIGLLLATVSPLVNPGWFAVPAYCGLLFESLFPANILCGLLWLFTHHKCYSIGSVIAAILAIVPLARTFSHSFCQKSEIDGEKHRLTLLTYNTHLCQNARKTPQNEVLGYVKESGADIVFLQEYEVRKIKTALTFEEAKSYLADTYPYTYFDFSIYNSRRQYGLALFSRYPLINKRTIRYESKANISDCCDVVVGADTFRLFNNHLESNRFSYSDIEPLTDERVTGSGVWRSFMRLTRKLREAYSYRAREVETVREEIAASPHPVIIAGDMNDVPVSYTYRNIRHSSKGLQDCFLSGSSFSTGHTYRFANGPFGVRIDYLFVSPVFSVEECAVGDVSYSDHLPLRAVICW